MRDGDDGHTAARMGPDRFLVFKIFAAVHVAGHIGIFTGQQDMIFILHIDIAGAVTTFDII